MSMRPGIILAAIIAIAAAAGLGVSALERPPPAKPVVQLVPTGPTPVPGQPSVAFAFSVADDPASGDVVLFGGVYDFDSTWLWNGRTWSLVRPAKSPFGRYGGAAAFDPQSDQILLFGGRLQPGTPVNDTWGWDGRTWQELNPGGPDAPHAGDGSQMAWDPSRNTMLLVTPPSLAGGGGETWIWSGARWQPQIAGALGSSFHDVALAFDPVSRTMLAEGCCQLRPSDLIAEAASTWRWDGSRWIADATPSPGDATGMALDPGRGELVLCNCDLVGGVVPSLYAWTGQAWVGTPSGSVPSQPQAAVDDVTRSEFLLLGFAISGGESIAQPIEVWRLSGSAWRQLGAGSGSG